MKKLFFICFVVICFATISKSQDKIEVSQQFLDDCNKAFQLVVEQRDALEKFKTERAKNEIERQSAQSLINGLNDLIKIKDSTIATYADIVKFQQQIIQFQSQIIEKLQAIINKPKSKFKQFLETVQKVLVFVGGVLVGRGLGF